MDDTHPEFDPDLLIHFVGEVCKYLAMVAGRTKVMYKGDTLAARATLAFKVCDDSLNTSIPCGTSDRIAVYETPQTDCFLFLLKGVSQNLFLLTQTCAPPGWRENTPRQWRKHDRSLFISSAYTTRSHQAYKR